MKVLHVVSNWKWTERSEPAADLAIAQQKQGILVKYLCGKPPTGQKEDAAHFASAKGINDVETIELSKHLKLHRLKKNVKGLRGVISAFGPDVIHCHLQNAHLTAGLARGGALPPVIVRSCYDPSGLEQGVRTNLLLSRYTDGVAAVCDTARGFLLPALSEERVVTAEPCIDTERFRPIDMDMARKTFDLPKDAFVVGLVSRIRKERRVDIAVNVLTRLRRTHRDLYLLAVGRGRGESVAELLALPAERSGAADGLVLAGYCRGERLVQAYNAMNLLLYPEPGTDKSCRTVREALACGVPVIASDKGILSQLIKGGITGRTLPQDTDSFTAAVEELKTDNSRIQSMRVSARKNAVEMFAPDVQARKTISFYENLLKLAK